MSRLITAKGSPSASQNFSRAVRPRRLPRPVERVGVGVDLQLAHLGADGSQVGQQRVFQLLRFVVPAMDCLDPGFQPVFVAVADDARQLFQRTGDLA
ncbi:hypothetical protein CDEF62S_00498 [Castellaniella defragrans]